MAALQLVTEGNWAKIPHINPFTRKAYETGILSMRYFIPVQAIPLALYGFQGTEAEQGD